LWSKRGLVNCAMRYFALLALVLVACAPSVQNTGSSSLPVTEASEETLVMLLAPFANTFNHLGIVVTEGKAYRYEGDDVNAFIQAINEFYRTNPGFCPLKQGFYPAESGVQFMTLAGRNTTEIRGFLYDQSQRPRLTYAYFEGTASQVFTATVCETARPSP
jgi:hypothetical protein